jgi:hypothetical protein
VVVLVNKSDFDDRLLIQIQKNLPVVYFSAFTSSIFSASSFFGVWEWLGGGNFIKRAWRYNLSI